MSAIEREAIVCNFTFSPLDAASLQEQALAAQPTLPGASRCFRTVAETCKSVWAGNTFYG